MEKTCMECIYHEVYLDEIDGEYFNDGCTCDNVEINEEYHEGNCCEYVLNGKYKGCPYFEEED
jgi:hypothetical protein